MSAQEVVRIQFLFDSNVDTFTNQLNVANARAKALESQMSRLGSAGLQQVHDQFAKTLEKSGQWQVSTVNNIHATREWGQRLAAQKLSLREATVAMAAYRKEAGLLNRVARENVRMRESVALKSSPGPGGSTMVTLGTPQSATIDNAAKRAMYAEERFKALNASIKNASTSMVNWGKNTQWAGRQMMVGMTLPIAALGVASAATFKKIDEELVRITKVYGDTLGGQNVNIAEVRKNATDLAVDIASTFGVAMEETLALTADLAAVGYTGDKLNKAVRETSRLALLGEVDRQAAMKTTLSLQTAFGLNTKQLTNAINFLNAAENATSTSLADMTEAIPRAGTVVNALGGDVQDLTLYITAMREGGINAAEGANAIKSGLSSIITPAKEASNYVKGFGIDLEQIIKQGGGDLTQTLMLFQDQLQKLDKLSQQRVISKLFGKFQMGRMTALFENLGKAGSQTNTILEIMGYTAARTAKMAETELSRATESASGKFNRAWQTLRANLAVIGEQFLNIGTWVVNVGNKVLSWFNDLNDVTKSWITKLALLAAATGPLVMISGILGNWVGHMVNFGRLAMAGFAKLGGKSVNYKMLDENDMAKQLGATIETGSYNAKLAVEALDKAIQHMTLQLKSLQNAALTKIGGVNLEKQIVWSGLKSEALKSPGLTLESEAYNRDLQNKDPRAFYASAMGSNNDKLRAAVVQKMAIEASMADYTAQGLSKDQIKTLRARNDDINNAMSGIKAGGASAQQAYAQLNSMLEQSFAGITQKYKDHIIRINAEIAAALSNPDVTARAAELQRIAQQGVLNSSINSTALAGQRTGGGRLTGWLMSLGLSQNEALALDLDNNQKRAISVRDAIKGGVSLESGHTSPDTMATSMVEAAMVASEEEYNNQKVILEQQTAELEKRKKALAQLAEIDQRKAAGAISGPQAGAEKKKMIQNDAYLKAQIGSVKNIQQFAADTAIMAKTQAESVVRIKEAENYRAAQQRIINGATAEEAAAERATAIAEKEQAAAAQAQARKARISRIVGGVGTASMMLPMMTGFMGEFGNKIAPVGMGASMGMMTGNPWGAVAGAGIMGGLQLFQSLKNEGDAASKALGMSALSAEVFGRKLRSMADSNVDDFLKSMTENGNAAKEAATAMQQFTEALNNAERGSIEESTVTRLQDLSGSNSIWEQLITGLLGNPGNTVTGPLQYLFPSLKKFTNPADVNPIGQAQGLLKERYATSILSGNTEEQALGEVAAYAKKTGLTYTLEDIEDSLKNIKSNRDVLKTLADQIAVLQRPGESREDTFAQIFNPEMIAQLTYQDLPALQSALDASGTTWGKYYYHLKHNGGQSEVMADRMMELSKTLNIDLSSALQLIIADLQGLPIAFNDFTNMTGAQIQTALNGIRQQQKLIKSAKDGIGEYFAKKQGKPTQIVNVEDAQEASQDAIDAAQEQSDAEIKAMEEAVKKRQEAMQDEIDATKKRYDDEIEAVQKAAQAKEDAFGEEQQRIQRAKDARASEIEYLRAMSEGRYYDAAAIQNEMEATRQQNQIEDAQKAKGKKAEKKIEGLTEERDAKLETLNDQLEKQQEHDQKMLEHKREHDQKMLEQMRESEQKRLESVQQTNKKIQESNKATGKQAEKVTDELIAAAKQGPAEMQKVLKKYHLSMNEAMALLSDRAGMSGLEAARAIGSNLNNADWASLAKGIEAKLDNDRNAETLFDKFWNSVGNIKNIGAATSVSGQDTKKKKKAFGGYISGPGTARSDSIPARLSNGEYVIQASSVAKVGVGNLNKINQQGRLPGFAEGGLVPDGRGISQSVTRVVMWDYINSLIDKRVKEAKDSATGKGGTVDAKGFNLDGVPTGEWGMPTRFTKWTTYAGHGLARDYQPDPVAMGAPVYSVGPGKVAGMNDGVKDQPFGISAGANSPSNWVLVWHEKKGQKYSTYYQHLKKNSVTVKPGDIVDHETMIGRLGNSGNTTGPHLHFEVRKGWNPRYTGDWNKEIQSIWNLINGGYIGDESNPTADGPMGVVRGYTNTLLKEYIDIYSKLGMSRKKATEKAQSDATSVASMGDSKSPEAARAYAKSMLGRYGWTNPEQWKALLSLWNRESGWRWYADNPTSDAYGIPQSLPGSKMRSAGSDWKTNPETQIKWGLKYIKDRYGSPLKAWGHSQQVGWYKDGGLVIPALRKGATINYDNTLANLHRGESVLTAPLTKKLKDGVGVASGGDVIYNVDITVEENMSAKQAENLVFHALDRHTVKVGRR